MNHIAILVKKLFDKIDNDKNGFIDKVETKIYW